MNENTYDFTGKKVAILTSGGDSQGMNSAIRSCSRMVLSLGARIFPVKWGYQGLVDGGENIKEYFWNDFSKIIHLGGTILGSARCKDFMKEEGRQKACLNMVLLGINHLVIIGGDGSLTGADIFRSEWSQHLAALCDQGKITISQKSELQNLSIVGMVGSIDNDFCGTDMTIGCDSALNRIKECVDSIITTAESHRRGFVIEIMGRHAGYLALSSGLSVGADFVFIPEFPPDSNWRECLCRSINTFLKRGKKYAIVLVAEGAQDKSGLPITANEVKDVLCKCAELDSRVTVLGHIQRGGSPSAYDRILGSRQGIEAAINVLTAKAEDPPYVICTRNIHIVRVPLSDCIVMCNGIKSAYNDLDIDRVVQLRGSSFVRSLGLFKTLQNLVPLSASDGPKYKFAVTHTGAPAAGMDPCSRAFVIWCLSKGHSVIGFKNGFEGVVSEDYIDLDWSAVSSWFSNAGSTLGASRFDVKDHVPQIAQVLKKLSINGLIIIGGHDSVFFLKKFHELRHQFDSLKIPIIMVPASISNNIACTSFALGADTTLNVIAECCDSLRLSARSSRKRIFVVETFGKKCGYLSTMSAISSAADNAYSRQNPPTIANLLSDIENFREKFMMNYLDFGLLIVSNEFSENYKVDTITQLLNEEGAPYFTGRDCVIGHIQQGSSPSPFDRFLSNKFGSKVAEKMLQFIETSKTNPNIFEDISTACMIASTCEGYKFFDYQQIIDQTNIPLRTPKNCWWSSMKNILNILSRSDFTYHSVTVPNAKFKRVGNLTKHLP